MLLASAQKIAKANPAFAKTRGWWICRAKNGGRKINKFFVHSLGLISKKISSIN
jgi:hypothetical protein